MKFDLLKTPMVIKRGDTLYKVAVVNKEHKNATLKICESPWNVITVQAAEIEKEFNHVSG